LNSSKKSFSFYPFFHGKAKLISSQILFNFKPAPVEARFIGFAYLLAAQEKLGKDFVGKIKLAWCDYGSS
jgi:hypothetical protein